MLIFEVTNVSNEKLVALGQFLLGRAEDTNAKRKISINAFIHMASSMGVSITANQLRDLATKEPLKNIIVNITDKDIIFTGAGQGEIVGDKMTVDQAQDTVEKMAKRAAK